MRFNLDNKQGIMLYDAESDRLKEKRCLVDVKEVKGNRTSLQNAARWKYLTMVADELNDRGETFTSMMGIEMKYNKDMLYTMVWEYTHETMYPSKKRLNTKEFSDVSDVVVMYFSSQKCVNIAWPDKDYKRKE